MNWNTLGIEPTKDKKAITAAYRQKLKQTNPEDKPEEFKALRAAYEEALSLADKQENAHAADNTPIEAWIREVAALYDDFSARIEPDKWEALFQADVCQGLDTRSVLEEAFLKFLMEKYYLPKAVWQQMEAVFHFSERIEELKERYPIDFLNNVIHNGLRLDPMLPYELFTPGKNGQDCDRYIQLFFEANQLSAKEQGAVLDKLDELSEKHPYGEVMRCRQSVEQGARDQGMAGLRELASSYPFDAHIQLSLAAMCLEGDDVEEAEAIAGRVLDKDTVNRYARNIIAHCLAKKGLFEKAKEILFELMRSCDSDPILVKFYSEQLCEWNDQMIPMCKARMSEAPEDWDNLIELVWCYIQNEDLEEAKVTAELIPEEAAEPYKYHNLMGKLYFNLQDCSLALPHFITLEKLIRELKPDGTEETSKRIARLPEVLQILGSCLMQLEETDEAQKKFREALELAPEDVDILLLMAKIHYTTGDHEQVLEIMEKVNALAPGRWHSILLMALSLYRLHRDREAFDAVNLAIATQVRDLSLYLLKIQILIRNNAWEEVHGILDFLRESGVPEDLSLEFVRAQLTELEAGDVKTAFAMYQKIARKVEAGEQIMWGSELYYRMSYLMGESMDMDKEEDRELLIAMLDKGLAQYGQDPDCLGYKAWILQRGGKIRDAVRLYREILEKNKRSAIARQGLMSLYYNNLAVCAEEALAWYEELLAEGMTAELCFFIASCKWHLGDFAGAEKYYRLELELDPDDADGYAGLAYLSDTQGEYEKSLGYIDQAIAATKRTSQYVAGLFEHKARILRRLGNYIGALAAVDEGAEYMEASERYQLKFDICCQFADWSHAGELVKEWKKKYPGDSGWAKAKGKLYLLKNKTFLGSVAMTFMGKNLSPAEVEDFQLQTQDLIGGYEVMIKVLKARAKAQPENDYVWMNLASAQKWNGKDKSAGKSAARALELIDKILDGNLTDEALYRCRKSCVLAILGRGDEAREELKKARDCRLCDYCPYGSCKDADIFEAQIEELTGNRDKAMELYRAGRKKWPDDLDFAAGMARIGRKGK